MSKKKKPRPQENEQERSRLSIPDEPNYSIAKFISNLYSNLSIVGKYERTRGWQSRFTNIYGH